MAELPEIEVEGEEASELYRYFHGIGIPEDAYQAIFEEFESWTEMARWPEEQEQNRIRAYTELLDCLASMVACEEGKNNGLSSLTDKIINSTITCILQDICDRIKDARGAK